MHECFWPLGCFWNSNMQISNPRNNSFSLWQLTVTSKLSTEACNYEQDTSVYFHAMLVTFFIRPSCCTKKKKLSFSNKTMSEAYTPLVCLQSEPFQFIKHQNSYVVHPNNERRSKRKPLSLHTSTGVMTLWIELSLECSPHQNHRPTS